MDTISKTAPVRAGTQAEGKHLVFNGVNRAQRRADAAAKSKPLPKSIWLITVVVAGMQMQTKTPIYRMTIERRTQRDELTIYSKEGAAPVVGGLLERMARPGGGEAAIWTDAKATKESIGGGYTRHAVPADWGFPQMKRLEDLEASMTFQNLNVGIPFDGPDYRQATREEFIENVARIGEINASSHVLIPFGEPVPEIDREPVVPAEDYAALGELNL